MANMDVAFEPRPEVYAAWRQLVTAIKSGMDERRYELATLAAARRANARIVTVIGCKAVR